MLKIKAKSLSSIFKNRNEAFYNSLWLLSERVITILFTFTVGIF